MFITTNGLARTTGRDCPGAESPKRSDNTGAVGPVHFTLAGTLEIERQVERPVAFIDKKQDAFTTPLRNGTTRLLVRIKKLLKQRIFALAGRRLKIPLYGNQIFVLVPTHTTTCYFAPIILRHECNYDAFFAHRILPRRYCAAFRTNPDLRDHADANRHLALVEQSYCRPTNLKVLIVFIFKRHLKFDLVLVTCHDHEDSW